MQGVRVNQINVQKICSSYGRVSFLKADSRLVLDNVSIWSDCNDFIANDGKCYLSPVLLGNVLSIRLSAKVTKFSPLLKCRVKENLMYDETIFVHGALPDQTGSLTHF